MQTGVIAILYANNRLDIRDNLWAFMLKQKNICPEKSVAWINSVKALALRGNIEQINFKSLYKSGSNRKQEIFRIFC